MQRKSIKNQEFFLSPIPTGLFEAVKNRDSKLIQQCPDFSFFLSTQNRNLEPNRRA